MAYDFLTNTGVIVPDTSTILAEAQTEFRTALGSDLIVSADTPQGVLITAEALARDAVLNNNAALANQINPNIAGGVFLDAIMALSGMERTPATRTVVNNVTLTGIAGTILSQNTKAQTAAGDMFYLQSAVTLDSTGNGVGNFASVDFGAVACAIGALNTIVDNVLGWETITNPTAGIAGTATQSDQEARIFRKNTLAFQGVSLAVAITSALYATAGVKSLAFRENTANTTQTIDGISMLPHSIYACVAGGSDTDVAAALLENKSAGCQWNGSTTINLQEPASGQTYAVKFARPTPIGILIKVTTSNGNSDNIKSSILDYANGVIAGYDGFTVGSFVSPFEISAAINAQHPEYWIRKVEISLASAISYSTSEIAIALSEIAVTQLSYISVVIA